MEKQTLAYLNSKIWYRLLKTVFVLMLTFFYGTTVLIILTEGFQQVDGQKTTIECLLGNKKTYTANELGLYLSISDFSNGFNYKHFFEGYNDYDIKKIMIACSSTDIDPDDIFVVQAAVENKYNDSIPSDEKLDALATTFKTLNTKFGNTEKAKYLTFDTKIFSINPVLSYSEGFLKLTLATGAALLIFEFVRRLFYYIVLGKMKPEIK